MTKFIEDQIKQIKTNMVRRKIIDFYYESDGDYFVMEFEDGFETSFRFMSDLINN